jgi:hypothetical protein
MYAVATFQMAHAMSLDFLEVIPHVFFWISLGAWVAASVEMARRLLPALLGAARRARTSVGR